METSIYETPKHFYKFVGKPYGKELDAEIKLLNPPSLRVKKPGVTHGFDYDPTRFNIHLNAARDVEGFSWG